MSGFVIKEEQREKILGIQREAWNKASSGWKKWDGMMMDFLKPVGEEMTRMLQIKPSYKILDVATGTGEPGLSMATLLTTGQVTGTDLSEEMLEVARENAMKRGINNYSAVCCESGSLPFENNSFDAVSCRFSFMFFPDMQQSLNEMLRVLKPGGKISAAVWNGPEKNFWISNSMEIMIRMLQLNPPVPGAPGAFRCAEQGIMNELFRQSGLINTEEREVNGKLYCGTVETYWNFIVEAASPLAFSKADAELQNRIREEAVNRLLQKYKEGSIALDSSATVICGEKKS